MAEVIPQIRVTDLRDETSTRDSTEQTPLLSPDSVNSVREGRLRVSNLVEAKGASNGISFPNKLIRTLSNSRGNDSHAGILDGRREMQVAIDPLSQHIFERTRPDNMTTQKLRPGGSPERRGSDIQIASDKLTARLSTDNMNAQLNAVEASVREKDKKKGVSFLSRFIGSKKKDGQAEVQDDRSEEGDNRAEGMDADVFSQPIGFIPRFPAPPKYIKVRSRGKKEKDFDRVFLAQELRGRTGVEIAQAGGHKGTPVNGLGQDKGSPSIWAMEFSKDGRHLAAGGHDRIVRVWAVISTYDDRQAHEREEVARNKEGQQTRLSAPVFKTSPVQEYEGHTASILDLSWSKNNFLLSSSMDKTVRLWHMSRTECLCCFKHSDFVTSIQFHPRDDRFFLAGSLDSKLRLWSIPDKAVAYSAQLTELITAVAFSPDGNTVIAGCLNGLCLFYETDGLKYVTEMRVKSAHGKNAKGSKITGIQAVNIPVNDPNGDVKLLITSNDSRVRVYNLRDKGLVLKLKGLENAYSQIHATFSDDANYVICGSEDRKVYIWSTRPPEKEKDKPPLEMFEAHSAIVTTSIMAPIATRQLLQASGDPLYELCNPPPVNLVSRAESHDSSRPPTAYSHNQDQSAEPTPKTVTAKAEESPAYIARSCHPHGNIIVTADYLGHIKVFRQDCAYKKRLRAETWDSQSTFSKTILNRSSSVATKNSKHSRRDSLTSQPSDRILSWRQSIERNNISHEGFPSPRVGLSSNRSVSPRKSLSQRNSTTGTPRFPPSPFPTNGHTNGSASAPRLASTTSYTTATTNDTSTSSLCRRPSSIDSSSAANGGLAATPSIKEESVDTALTTNPKTCKGERKTETEKEKEKDPLMLQGAASYMFWNKSTYAEQAKNSLQLRRVHTKNPSRETSTSAASRSRNNSFDGRERNGSFDERSRSIDDRTESFVGSRVGSTAEAEGLGSGSGSEEEGDEHKEVKCEGCGGSDFKMVIKKGGAKGVQCGNCGRSVD